LAKRAVTPNATGTNNGYYFSWWSDEVGSVTYTMGTGGAYGMQWSNTGNFVGGKGWATGSARTITYTGTVNCAGNFYVAIYGWTKNPLIEYYIVETFGTYNPASGASNKGSITTDGSSYQLGVSTRTNQPSIVGTATFQQFWSTRANKRVGGTVTVGTHFNAWSSAGMTLGTHDYQIVATEGYQSSGSASMNVGGSASSGGSTCTDTQVPGDPYGCTQQAAWGNCGQSYMQSPYCNAACRRC
jgi:endo-1,4-beta-xylanase